MAIYGKLKRDCLQSYLLHVLIKCIYDSPVQLWPAQRVWELSPSTTTYEDHCTNETAIRLSHGGQPPATPQLGIHHTAS